MAKYELHRKNGEVFELEIFDHEGILVSSVDLGGDVQLINYEGPGTNGGKTIFNGRLQNVVTKVGQIIAADLTSAQKLVTKINGIKNTGEVVVLVAPVGNDDTGEYFIQSFKYRINPGKATSLTFTMSLSENREANIRRASVNLVNFQESEALKTRFRTLLGAQS